MDIKIFIIFPILAILVYLRSLWLKKNLIKKIFFEAFTISLGSTTVGLFLLYKSLSITINELNRFKYIITIIICLGFGLVFLHFALLWLFLRKKEIETTFNYKKLKQFITEEVDKKIPDIDNLFRYQTLLTNVSGILIAGLIGLAAIAINLILKTKP